MKTAQFDRLARQVLSPLLEEREGYAFDRGGYWRDTPSGVGYRVLLDFDARNAKTFRTMVGFNSPLIVGDRHPVEAGVFGVAFVGRQGLSADPQSFPCATAEIATESLQQQRELIEAHVLPWFARHDSLAALAGVVEPEHLFIAGKLWFLAGHAERAKEFLERHLEYLRRYPPSDDVVQGVRETREILEQCP
jgi:hypothetical protein